MIDPSRDASQPSESGPPLPVPLNPEISRVRKRMEIGRTALPHAVQITEHTGRAILNLAKADELLTDAEIVERFERDGVVKTPPRFHEQLSDETRTATFEFTPVFRRGAKVERDKYRLKQSTDAAHPIIEGRTSEAEGLKEIHSILGSVLHRFQNIEKLRDSGKMRELAAISGDVIENLTFVGQPEFDEAVRGLGLMWKDYLDGDPRRKLCVLAAVNRLSRFVGMPKSDEYVLDGVLASWSPEDRAKYGGRLVTDTKALANADPRKSKIVLIDDWTMSGRQMRDNYLNLLNKDPVFERYAQSDRVEINLLVASEERIINGLKLIPSYDKSRHIPVKAYYRSHDAKTSYDSHRSYVSGLHCYANTGFGDVMIAIARRLGNNAGMFPKLARVFPRYKVEPRRFNVTDTEIVEELSGEDANRARRIIRGIMQTGMPDVAVEEVG